MEQLFGSENAYYEIDLDQIIKEIERYENQNVKNKIRRLNNNFNNLKLNHYEFIQKNKRDNDLPRRAKYLRSISNKKVRTYNKEIKSGAMYRKIYDYKWELD